MAIKPSGARFEDTLPFQGSRIQVQETYVITRTRGRLSQPCYYHSQ